MKRNIVGIVTVLVGLLMAATVHADVVTDWNQNMAKALFADKTSPLVTCRVTAIVEGAVFDAVNSIEHRYTPLHETSLAPHGASQRAAAIMTAYTSICVVSGCISGSLKVILP